MGRDRQLQHLLRYPACRILIIFSLLLPARVFPHGGGLDASGCHYNRKTGEYHCHRRGATTVKPRKNRPAIKSYKGTEYTCGSKHYCREMVSCAEAMYYLNKCGLSRLDGDSDGVPCEVICGSH